MSWWDVKEGGWAWGNVSETPGAGAGRDSQGSFCLCLLLNLSLLFFVV